MISDVRHIKFVCASLAVLMLLCTGCGTANAPASLYNPATGLTILGLDGATWDVIDILIARGELPGFKALKESGAWGDLDTFVPTESVSIWTSLATGVTPTRHGIQTFTRRIPGTDRFVPSPGTDRQVPAIWNIVSDAGQSVVSVKWFASWPAEPVNGAMLSPRLEKEDAEPRTWPTELFSEIDHFRHMTTMDQLPQPPRRQLTAPKMPPQTPAAGAPPMLIGQDQVEATMFDDTSVWQAGRYVYEKYRPDLFMLYLKSTDRVEHFLWGAHEIDDPDPEQRMEAEAIFGWYRYYDGIIQSLLKDPDRTLMVISDHGMRDQSEIEDPYYIWDMDFDAILSALGFLTRSAGGTDWENTRAYTYRRLPYDRTIIFRLNLAGREPDGTVPPGKADVASRTLRQALASIKTSGGAPLFDTVSTGDTPDECIARLSGTLTLDDTVRIGGTAFSLRDFLVERGLPRGIHTDAPPGIIAVHGPGIASGHTVENASVFDVTPTALYVLGIPVARDFDGRVLTGLFEKGYLENNPVQWIPTYGVRAIDADLTTTGGDERVLDELRALGYIN